LIKNVSLENLSLRRQGQQALWEVG